MEDQATNEHEQNTGSPDTDKQHINEPSIEQNITEQTMDRPNTDEVDMYITEEADNHDTNSHQNSSTNQHPSHNKDNMHNHKHNSIDFIDVPKLGKLRNNLCLLWRFSLSESVRPHSDAKLLVKHYNFLVKDCRNHFRSVVLP